MEQPPCQISGSKVITFESCLDTHKDTHTHTLPSDCSIRPLKWSVNIDLDHLRKGIAAINSMNAVEWGVSELCEAFSLFDKDGDGQITVDEVAQTMSSLGIDVRLSDVQVMVDQVDTDGQNNTQLAYNYISRCSRYC